MQRIYRMDVLEGEIVRRINRFVVETRIDGRRIYAHLTNTGRLVEYLVSGRGCLLSRISGGRLKYRLISIEDGDGYAIIDTLTQNRAFIKLIEMDGIRWLRGYRVKSINPRIDGLRLDYVLSNRVRDIYVETKSAVLRGENNEAMYPDCPTIRGRRHIGRIIDMYRSGYDVMLIFIAGLPGARCFKPYHNGDRVTASLIGEAYVTGVPVKAISIYMDGDGSILLDNDDLPLCYEWIECLG